MNFSALIKGVLDAIGLLDWLKNLLNNWQQRQAGKAQAIADIEKEAFEDAKKQANTFAAPERDKRSIVQRMRDRISN